MPRPLRFHKRFDFSYLPRDWTVSRVTVDWGGSPLVLVEEGRPPYPGDPHDTDARIAWLNTPPKARHLIYWEGLSERVLRFEKSTGVFAFHVQPLGEGWLLGETRGGRTDVYDRAGRAQRTLDLGDASKDLQTTPNGHIWVSYFDEGVYGGGVGSQQGVVCFDSSGQPIFKYFDFAEQNELPFIDDCYAMNVVDDGEVWLSYYSFFHWCGSEISNCIARGRILDAFPKLSLSLKALSFSQSATREEIRSFCVALCRRYPKRSRWKPSMMQEK